MKRRTCLATVFVAALCLLTSGCFTIEQEIFLEPDGSGDLVIHVSMPDFPDDSKKNLPPMTEQDPEKLIEDIKQISKDLPPTLKLKEVKELRRNGARAYYIVVHFNQLKDVDSISKRFSEGLAPKEGAPSSNSQDEYKIEVNKVGDLTVITQRLYLDMAGLLEKGKSENAPPPIDPPPPVEPPKSVAKKSGVNQPGKRGARQKPNPTATKAGAAKEENPAEGPPADMMKGLLDEEVMKMVFSAMFKLRFVVHAPKNISETNADIVLNGKTAIWNASFGAFIKEKKPIEMKLAY